MSCVCCRFCSEFRGPTACLELLNLFRRAVDSHHMLHATPCALWFMLVDWLWWQDGLTSVPSPLSWADARQARYMWALRMVLRLFPDPFVGTLHSSGSAPDRLQTSWNPGFHHKPSHGFFGKDTADHSDHTSLRWYPLAFKWSQNECTTLGPTGSHGMTHAVVQTGDLDGCQQIRLGGGRS